MPPRYFDINGPELLDLWYGALHRQPIAAIIDNVDDIALMQSMLDDYVTKSNLGEDFAEEEQRIQVELAKDRSNTRRSMDLFLDEPTLGTEGQHRR